MISSTYEEENLPSRLSILDHSKDLGGKFGERLGRNPEYQRSGDCSKIIKSAGAADVEVDLLNWAAGSGCDG